MESFSKQVDKAITNILDGFKNTIAGTTVELFGEVVAKTPIKSGHTISSWKASVGTSVIPTQQFYFSEYVPSKPTAFGISKTFVGTIEGPIHNAEIGTGFTLMNDADSTEEGEPKILVLENGGYDSIPTHETDPDPPYYPESVYQPPFTLLTGGAGGAISKKAPYGMVKVSLADSGRIFHSQFNKWGK
jgi:hypothetical protein